MTRVMSNHVLVRLEIVLVSVQDRCMVSAGHPYPHKSFWAHPMVPLGYKAIVKARFGPFGDSANLDTS